MSTEVKPLEPPLRSEQLPEERLGKLTALAVLASDNTGRDLAREMTRLPNATVITVPYHVRGDDTETESDSENSPEEGEMSQSPSERDGDEDHG